MSKLRELGFDRDVALHALLDNQWSLDGALRDLVPDPEEPRAEISSRRALGVDDEGCANACGRTCKHRSRFCCVHCPSSHTRTCWRRNHGSLAHRIYLQSRTADAAQAPRPSAPPPPPAGSASAPPPPPAGSASTPRWCPICMEDCFSVLQGTCGHATCGPCAEAMRRRGIERCALCRARWQVAPEPEVQQAQENETGYVVLGYSPDWDHVRGRHPLSLCELELRLGFRPGTLAGRLHEHNLVLRHYCGVGMAQMWWTELGLSGTPPLRVAGGALGTT